jgi:hypothetical protein
MECNDQQMAHATTKKFLSLFFSCLRKTNNFKRQHLPLCSYLCPICNGLWCQSLHSGTLRSIKNIKEVYFCDVLIVRNFLHPESLDRFLQLLVCWQASGNSLFAFPLFSQTISTEAYLQAHFRIRTKLLGRWI